MTGFGEPPPYDGENEGGTYGAREGDFLSGARATLAGMVDKKDLLSDDDLAMMNQQAATLALMDIATSLRLIYDAIPEEDKP